LGYKQTPDYDKLRGLLSKLQVPTGDNATASVSDKKKAAAVAKRTADSISATRTTRTRVAKRESPNKDDDLDRKRPARMKRSQEDSDEEEDFVTSCGSEAVEDAMDWEVVDTCKNAGGGKAKLKATSVGLKFVCTAGPHKGESFYMVQGENDTMTLGLAADFSLTADSTVDPVHAKLTLQTAKTFSTVVVKDLKSSSGTFVKGRALGKGKEQKLFVSDTFQVGNSSFEIRAIPASELGGDEDHENKEPNERSSRAAAKAIGKKVAHQEPSDASMMDEHNKKEGVASKGTGFGVVLQIIGGPHSGERIILEQGAVEAIVLGSKPRSKVSSDQSFALAQDSSVVDPCHVRFELNTSHSKFYSITVTDLKSTVGTVINSTKLAKGKSLKAFLNDQVKIGDTVVEIKKL
jgi:pSer/pThr/pTyr-binding forkhead associated (FHA) protein